jgi:hypothetical protein
MASFSSTYPSQRPVFTLDAANAGRLDPRCSFSRASTGTFFGTDKHLSSDNILLQSSTFNTTWSNNSVAIASGQTDPAGGTNGFTLTENSLDTYHRVYQGITASGDFAFTVYAKQNSGTRYLTLTIKNANNDWVSATYDLAGGSPATGSGSSSNFSNLSATQTASGNSYYKCVLKATGSVSSDFAYLYMSDDATAAVGTYGLKTYQGDGSSSIDVAFASLSTVGATDYNATTTQIHREYAPTLQTAASGAARFEHSATDGQSAGILIESQSTNLISYSDDTTNSWWFKSESTATGDTAVGPTGALTADLLVPNATTNANHYLQKTGIATTVSTTYTYSLYVKSAGVTKFAILMFQNTSPFTQFGFASVDLGAGTINGTIGSGATIQAASNGWYRVSVSGAALTTVSNPRLWFQDSAGNFNHTPNGYDGLLVAGQQFEANSFPSSLVSTSGANATRAADSLSMPIASTGYTGGPVTLLADSTTETDTNNPITIIMYRDGNNQIDLFGKSPNNRSAYIQSGSQYSIITTSSAANGVRAMRVDTNDIATAINGTIDGTDTSQTLPDLTGATVYIGDDSNGGNSIDGHIKRVAIYNEALSDTNLQALTS